MTILDEHDIDNVWMDSKIKMTQPQLICTDWIINKTQIKEKQQNNSLNGNLKQIEMDSLRIGITD